MPHQLIDVILKTVILIPGIVGLSPIDFSKTNFALKEEDWHKSLSMKTEKENCYEISIAIIVKKQVSAKTIASEVNSAIQNILTREKVTLATLNIYIRGIK